MGKRYVPAPPAMPLSVAAVLGIAAAATAQGREPAGRATDRSPQAAEVCELKLPKLLDGRHDARVVVYYRKGFYHGYATVGGDNRPHPVDPTPAAPFGYFYEDGREFAAEDYQTLTGVYAYKGSGYRKYYDLWKNGKLIPQRLQDVPPLQRNGTALSGTIDVLIRAHVKPGAQAYFQGRAFRVTVRAALQDQGQFSGTYEAHEFSVLDRLFRPIDRRRTTRGACAGRWRDDFWQPGPGTKYTVGRDWPSVRGPYLNGSAGSCGAALVDDLSEARLLWVSQEVIPGGRGARRNPLDPRPAIDFPAGSDAYGAPVVSGAKVYLYCAYADVRHLAAETDLLQVRGAPRTFGPKAYSDVVFCFDARTGKTLWRREFPWGLSDRHEAPPSGKAGRGLSPCVYGRQVFARGCRAMYCLDADTGEPVWTNEKFRGGGGSWSRDQSPVVIGGILLVKPLGQGTTLVGLDPGTGRELWRQPNVGGDNAVPSRVVLEGREYVVSALGGYSGDMTTGRMVMIDPAGGKILWETDEVCKNECSLCVLGDVVLADVKPVRKSADRKKELCRLGAFRVTRRGATRLWTSPSDAFFSGRFITPLAHGGHVYVDSHGTGHFSCIDARSGKVVREFAEDIDKLAGHTGGGNWCVATDDRIIASGLLMFRAAPKPFEMIGKPWRLPFAIGYCCPIKPAIADGRLFVRLDDCLVCYDLRELHRP